MHQVGNYCLVKISVSVVDRIHPPRIFSFEEYVEMLAIQYIEKPLKFTIMCWQLKTWRWKCKTRKWKIGNLKCALDFYLTVTVQIIGVSLIIQP